MALEKCYIIVQHCLVQKRKNVLVELFKFNHETNRRKPTCKYNIPSKRVDTHCGNKD